MHAVFYFSFKGRGKDIERQVRMVRTIRNSFAFVSPGLQNRCSTNGVLKRLAFPNSFRDLAQILVDIVKNTWASFYGITLVLKVFVRRGQSAFEFVLHRVTKSVSLHEFGFLRNLYLTNLSERPEAKSFQIHIAGVRMQGALPQGTGNTLKRHAHYRALYASGFSIKFIVKFPLRAETPAPAILSPRTLKYGSNREIHFVPPLAFAGPYPHVTVEYKPTNRVRQFRLLPD